MSKDKNNWTLKAVPGGSAPAVVSPKSVIPNRFFKAKDRREVYVAFGPTAPIALRRLAEGLVSDGIVYVDAVTISPEWDATDGSESAFSATGYVYGFQE